MPHKPTFARLMTLHKIGMGQLAHESHVSSLLVWQMSEGKKPMDRKDAEQILDGLNRLCRTSYTLDAISISLREG